MKISKLVTLIILLALIGGTVWLLRGADPKHLDRQETRIDVADTFER